MLEKLKRAEERFLEIESNLAAPDLMTSPDKYLQLMKEYKSLTPIVEKYREYIEAQNNMAEAEELSRTAGGDAELRELAQSEYKAERARAEKCKEELTVLLLPRDPDDDKNVIMEIRAGAGGEEAALFAADLYRMYTMYTAGASFRTELLSANETELGGYREVSFLISGENVFSRFKFERGVHRVQRVPETEAQGRIQTSTVTVAVLPEVEEVDVQINPADLKIETCKSSGAGGQHINKTESAIRILHVPSGIVVECQEERSQFKNRDKAMRMLRARLYEIKQTEQNEKIASDRKSQVGTGDRSERIRTYNFPQGRVTDHRIGLTLYTLDRFMNGEIAGMLDALATADTAERLKGATS